jgi:hypothetical protein
MVDIPLKICEVALIALKTLEPPRPFFWDEGIVQLTSKK